MNIAHKVIEMNSNSERSEVSFNKIICVTQYEEIEKGLKDTEIHVIRNYNSDLGISNSIKIGINYDMGADGYMFMVCDQPFIKKETILRIINTFSKGAKGIVGAGTKDMADEERRYVIGNPVIFSRKYINELLALEGDKGGKKVVMNHLDDVEIVQIQDAVELVDIDTKEAYEILKNNFKELL